MSLLLQLEVSAPQQLRYAPGRVIRNPILMLPGETQVKDGFMVEACQYGVRVVHFSLWIKLYTIQVE